MAVTALVKFEVIPKQFGNQLDLLWETSTTRPTNWKVFIFQRKGANVTDEEIASYFTNIDNLTGYNYNGLFVFDKFKSAQDYTYIYSNFIVLNDERYYYKAVIRNQDTEEYSTALSANAIPLPTLIVKIRDGKELVTQAIKKLFDAVKNINGDKMLLTRDITIFKQFMIGAPKENWIMIERINGSTRHDYWGHVKNQDGADTVFGSTDSDMIRATFVTLSGNDRRDLVTNLFRAYKLNLERLIKALGNFKVNNCQITIEGDYYNPTIHGEIAVGVTVIFALEIENEVRTDELEITTHEVEQHKMVIGE
ncbi:MAG: hypothetical protein RDU14_16720 [Melioribacteraceae bacterium]|nr:hypothetical protein [Melioribacteraceae bacterium]